MLHWLTGSARLPLLVGVLVAFLALVVQPTPGRQIAPLTAGVEVDHVAASVDHRTDTQHRVDLLEKSEIEPEIEAEPDGSPLPPVARSRNLPDPVATRFARRGRSPERVLLAQQFELSLAGRGPPTA